MAKASDFLIAVDDGHGPHTAGKRTPFIPSLGRQIRENEFNKAVVDLLEAELKRCGFRTLQLAPTDLDTHLTTRTNAANRANANLLVSVHFNAMGNTFEYSSAKGFSVHIQEGSSDASQSYKAAKLMIEELAKGTAQTNRGVVRQNLAITRQSTMPAVLVECGFMDDPNEAMLMISRAFQQEVAQELATAICRHFGVPYIEGKGIVQVSNEVRDYFMLGDNLPGVSILQSKLNKAGHNLTVDSIYGKGTENAVKAFQRTSGLVADGIAGKATMSKLDVIIANINKPITVKPSTVTPKEETQLTYKKDAQPSKSLAPEFNAAVKAGITDGTYPHRPVTREEAAVMAYRAAELAKK